MRNIFTLLFLTICVATQAQDRPRDGKMKFDPEQHKIHQHQFICDEADFSAEDSVAFFTIYDEMRQKEFELFGKHNNMRPQRPKTDEECRQMMIHRDSVELQMKQIQLMYHQKLLHVIRAKKAAKAIMAGEDFDKRAFRELTRRGPRPDDMDKRLDGPRPDGPRPERDMRHEED